VNAGLAAAAYEAADRHGTPLYLYDLARLEADASVLRQAFPDPWLRLYSLKANGLPALARRVARAGFGVSAVSGGELALAARAGVAPAQTALEGIGKTPADLARAASLAAAGTPLLWVSLESAAEAAALAAALRAAGGRRPLRQDVLIRLNPGVAPETVAALAVGAPLSKFGITADELPALIEAGGGPSGPLRWRGLHLHVGSQLGAIDAWRSAVRLGLRVLELQRAALADFDTLDVGGGMPVAMDPNEPDSVPAPGFFGQAAETELATLSPSARPARLAIEPGRAVVAACGWLIASVLHVRRRERPIVVLDAGMTELIRPALYGAHHPLVALTSHGRPTDGSQPDLTVRVDGPICESTDVLGDADLPPLERGDRVAIGVAGAYASSMFSSYNGRPRPPEVAWDGRRLVTWRRRGRGTDLP
jgi:diaminopimelate decarboxylase